MKPIFTNDQSKLTIIIAALDNRHWLGLHSILITIPQTQFIGRVETIHQLKRLSASITLGLLLVDFNLGDQLAMTLLDHSRTILPVAYRVAIIDWINQMEPAYSVGADDVLIRGFNTLQLTLSIQRAFYKIEGYHQPLK